eukprot:UN34478
MTQNQSRAKQLKQLQLKVIQLEDTIDNLEIENRNMNILIEDYQDMEETKTPERLTPVLPKVTTFRDYSSEPSPKKSPSIRFALDVDELDYGCDTSHVRKSPVRFALDVDDIDKSIEQLGDVVE